MGDSQDGSEFTHPTRSLLGSTHYLYDNFERWVDHALLAPFDFEVRVSDPTLSDEEAHALGVECCTLDELLPWSDVLSLQIGRAHV